MIEGGKGGANTNANGLPFEQCVLRGHMSGKTYLIGDKPFIFLKQGDFVKHMTDLKDPYWDHGKRPDGAYVSHDRKTIIIIEVKHQKVAGTADEKIRAGPCLIDEYKVLYPSVKHVHLMFIVNEFFAKKKYEIAIKFNEKHGIPVFFAKQTDVSKMYVNTTLRKIFTFNKVYTVDEDAINDWMTERSLQSC
jgi:hypothetical protein